MNFVFINTSEIVEANVAVIGGIRKEELLTQHEIELQNTFPVAVENIGLGRGTCGVGNNELRISYAIERPPPPRLDLELLVAVPRPQTVKKLLQLVSSTGCRKISFIRSDNIIPSYLQSKTLTPEGIKRECRLACEQVGDCRFPEVEIFRSLNSWMSSTDLKSQGELLLADTEANAQVGLKFGETPAVIGIGPESGWSVREREAFGIAGFRACRLGNRIYRVETAATLLVSRFLDA